MRVVPFITLLTPSQFNADVGAVDVDGNLSVDHAKDDQITTLLSRYMDHYGTKCLHTVGRPSIVVVITA